MIQATARINPKMVEVIRVFEYFLKFHGLTGKKPNRHFRRLAKFGVKIGKNTPHTKAKLRMGALRRVRQTLI